MQKELLIKLPDMCADKRKHASMQAIPADNFGGDYGHFFSIDTLTVV